MGCIVYENIFNIYPKDMKLSVATLHDRVMTEPMIKTFLNMKLNSSVVELCNLKVVIDNTIPKDEIHIGDAIIKNLGSD